MKKKTQFSSGINVGSASLAMVFSILCLTVFSVLSLITANNDYKLAEKNSSSLKEYYSADYNATEFANALITTYTSSSSAYNEETVNKHKDEYSLNEKNENGIITAAFSVPINEKTALSASLEIKNGKATILKWRIEDTYTQEYDTSLPVWNGEDSQGVDIIK